MTYWGKMMRRSCLSSFSFENPKKYGPNGAGCKKGSDSSGTFRSYGIRVMGPTLFL